MTYAQHNNTPAFINIDVTIHVVNFQPFQGILSEGKKFETIEIYSFFKIIVTWENDVSKFTSTKLERFFFKLSEFLIWLFLPIKYHFTLHRSLLQIHKYFLKIPGKSENYKIDLPLSNYISPEQLLAIIFSSRITCVRPKNLWCVYNANRDEVAGRRHPRRSRRD